MRRRILFAVVVLAVVFLPVIVSAQDCSPDLQYNPRTVLTVIGTATTAINYNPANPSSCLSSVIVTSGDRNYTVFLGPGSYINRLGLIIRPGDQVTVVGSLSCVACGNYFVASTLYACNQTYNFRSAAGIPLWSGTGYCPPRGAGPVLFNCGPFDPHEMVTLTGDIFLSYDIQTGECNVPVVAVLLRQADNTFYTRVILGPRDYLETRHILLRSGDHLWIRGSATKLSDVWPTVIATQVAQGNPTVDLRTPAGIPMWIRGNHACFQDNSY